MKTNSLFTIVVLVGLSMGLVLSVGCASEADLAADNLVVAAENFEVLRSVIFYNGITGDFIYAFEGLCSIEDQGHHVEVTCKTEKDNHVKHIQGLSDNITYTVIQLDESPVSGYRPRILVRPETIIPDFELDLSFVEGQ